MDPTGPTFSRHYRHYWLDWADMPGGEGPTAGFWPVDLQEDHEPYRALTTAQRPADASAVFFGCRDGYVRRYRVHWETDEGWEIEAYVAYGPIRAGGNDHREGLLTEIIITAGEQSGRIGWWVYAGASHEACVESAPVYSGASRAGRGYTKRPRVRAGSVMLLLGNAETDRKWAIEAVSARLKPVGRQRMN